MCNGTMIANKLKTDEDIKIIGIFVGPDPDVTPPPKEAHWMRDWLVSITDEGEPLFAHVEDYTEVQDAIMYLFERLDLVQSR